VYFLVVGVEVVVSEEASCPTGPSAGGPAEMVVMDLYLLEVVEVVEVVRHGVCLCLLGTSATGEIGGSGGFAISGGPGVGGGGGGAGTPGRKLVGHLQLEVVPLTPEFARIQQEQVDCSLLLSEEMYPIQEQ
jgi:hypothetical protein